MKNNAYINMRFKDLINVMDARAYANIFINDMLLERERSIKYAEVFEILADKDFIKAYGDYDVVGLINMINVTNILIKEV